MEIWLPIMALVIGALMVFSMWAFVGRHRLSVRMADLSRSLETTTTELESARIQLQRLSTEDPLTAVANHEQFLEFLEREWRRSRRDGLPLTLVVTAILSAIAWLVFRRLWPTSQGERRVWDRDIND